MGIASVLIAGTSTRACAESAAMAGFTVIAIDAFGDLDQHPGVRVVAIPSKSGLRPGVQAFVRAARSLGSDTVCYAAPFENAPGAAAILSSGRTLWGNSPDVLRRVRDPALVAETLHARGFPTPHVCVPADCSVAASGFSRTGGAPAVAPGCGGTPSVPSIVSGFGETASVPGVVSGFSRTPGAPSETAPIEWLVKPLASGGGSRVRRLRRQDYDAAGSPWVRPPRGCYLQARIEGTPGSIVFVAAGGRAVPFGVSRQIVGEHAFGSRGYRYCGSILTAARDGSFANDEAVVARASALAASVTEAFGLVGVNGLDFVARAGIPYLVEVNPRWCASMELVERRDGLSVFGAHAAACGAGELPVFDLAGARRGAMASGKAVVFARRAVTIGNTHPWLEDSTVRDVPHPGERILAGRPVCTVFAKGANAAACHAALLRRAEQVYALLARWERRTVPARQATSRSGRRV